jgi:expansin
LGVADYYSPTIDGTSYGQATLCGAYARVTGAKGSVLIKIVDHCPDDICTQGHIDLSPEAFAAIDDPIKGYVPITWQLVSVVTDQPVRFRYKQGSSQWWTAIQVSHLRNPVASLEVLVNGSWTALARTDYNYFIESDGLGPGYHTFRITDVFGHQLVEQSPVYLDGYMAEEVDWEGNAQFPGP